MNTQLLSVGIDVGTTTTQLVFSRLTIKNEACAFRVPQYAITEKEIIYRSKIHFTPLISQTVIDAQGVKKIVDEEYAAAKIPKSDVQTGAVIITGETAQKENAREVLHALSGYAGDFVVATAGPALESILAGKGSGAAAYSLKHQCAVVNLDIGGGTTNFALFENGKLLDKGCLNVGGRMMRFDEKGHCIYLSPFLAPYFTPSSDPVSVAAFLAEILEEALGLRNGDRYRSFITDKLCKPAAILSFSGGVADLIDDLPREIYAYGDLGVLLGKAIFHSRLCGKHYLKAKETIRATVIGAGSHSTELSGSTIFYNGIRFPLKNLPVISLDEDEATDEHQLADRIRTRRSVFSDQTAVIALKGKKNPKFSELCKLADGIALTFRNTAKAPVIVAVEEDMGKALGQAIAALCPNTPIICLDDVHLPDGAYLDIGAPIADGQVLPVVIKTLVI